MNKKDYNENETVKTERTVKHKVYDSVFIDLFSYKENLKDLYKALLKDKAKSDITEDDINVIDIEKVFINDLYNDLRLGEPNSYCLSLHILALFRFFSLKGNQPISV